MSYCVLVAAISLTRTVAADHVSSDDAEQYLLEQIETLMLKYSHSCSCAGHYAAFSILAAIFLGLFFPACTVLTLVNQSFFTFTQMKACPAQLSSDRYAKHFVEGLAERCMVVSVDAVITSATFENCVFCN